MSDLTEGIIIFGGLFLFGVAGFTMHWCLGVQLRRDRPVEIFLAWVVGTRRRNNQADDGESGEQASRYMNGHGGNSLSIHS